MGRKKKNQFVSILLNSEVGLEWFLFLSTAFVTLYWLTGEGLFYSDRSPVLSPFTSISLFVMVGCRLAEKRLVGWSKPMSLALLGVVVCGNASSMLMLMIVPELVLVSAPSLVPTSILTSVGIMSFGIYEIFITVRKSPQSGLLIDDIFLHLALMPGALSLLGLVLDVPVYRGVGVDPRAGIGLLEMFFMGTFAVYAVVSNPNLFMWDFLTRKVSNRVIFSILFLNQYVLPIAVGLIFSRSPQEAGIEFFVLLAGFFATLSFLMVNAVNASDKSC